MKPLRSLALVAALLSLSGCNAFNSINEVRALNKTQAVGSPFTQALSEEYKHYANTKLLAHLDYPDALHFARKGLTAASGETVMPEPISDWNLSEQNIGDLTAARGRLIMAYDMGAREGAPALAARAQSAFDCWMEQQEEDWMSIETECQLRFSQALGQLESTLIEIEEPPALAAIDVEEIIAEPVDEEPMTPMDLAYEDTTPDEPMKEEDAIYLVFFNWDSTELSSSALNVLDAVARETQKHPPLGIELIGHADSSGPSTYNQRLAFKRAIKVRDALVARGIDLSMVSIEGRGEEDLLVPTPDNVREPANRRASISFKYEKTPQNLVMVDEQPQELAQLQ